MEQMEIQIKGQIDQNWADWLGGLTIAYTENGRTILTGSVRDQAALHGLLSKLAELGLPLVSVTSIGVGVEKP